MNAHLDMRKHALQSIPVRAKQRQHLLEHIIREVLLSLRRVHPVREGRAARQDLEWIEGQVCRRGAAAPAGCGRGHGGRSHRRSRGWERLLLLRRRRSGDGCSALLGRGRRWLYKLLRRRRRGGLRNLLLLRLLVWLRGRDGCARMRVAVALALPGGGGQSI